MEEIKMYKCYDKDGTYKVYFSRDGETFNSFNDLSGGVIYEKSDFTKVEPIETDTLQEVVEWCRENEKGLVLFSTGIFCRFESVKRTPGTKMTQHELLTHIRKPKLKQITPEQLAKMGYVIKE